MPKTKIKRSRGQIGFDDPIFVDGFAGGGDWSTGFEIATGKTMTIAINHDEDAVLMHTTNHPFTEHYLADIYEVSPRKAVRGRHVAWAHFSPDCKHFSKAKGSKPVEKKIRGLAWVVLRWAAEVQPDIISLENVEEFQTWGPIRKGRPVKSKMGTTFQQWKRQLQMLGYVVEHRELVACDYGAPTSRKRLFVLARRDGKPIVWPAPTHGDPNSEAVQNGDLLPWRTAADIIDWSLPCPSIFASKAEIKEQYGLNAVRPLANNTLKRVIGGVDRFVLKSENPYILRAEIGNLSAPSVTLVNHGGEFRGQDIETPLQTVTGKHGYGISSPVLTPVMMVNNTNAAGSSVDSPLHTITTGGHHIQVAPVLTALGQTGSQGDRCRRVDGQVHTTVSKAETCLVTPSLMHYHSEQSGNVRGQDLRKPTYTVDAANRHALVAPTMAKYYGSDARGHSIEEPVHTITTKDREGLISAAMVEYHGASAEQPVTEPVATTLSHAHDALTVPYISKYYSGGYDGVGIDIDTPLPTVTAVDHNAVVAAHVIKMKGSNLGHAAEEPLQTVTASGLHFGAVMTTIVKVTLGMDLKHWPQVRSLLNTYCGYSLADDEVLLLGIDGIWYFIADIGLRMLSPRELYNANGFPLDYIIDRDNKGNSYGKTKQVARCGNAVPPPFATALVRANAPEYCQVDISTMRELNNLIAV